MNFLVLGINHKTANVDVREKVAFTPEQMTDALHAACAAMQLEELAIVSTCNRTEVYAAADGACASAIIDWLADYRGVDRPALQACCYQFVGNEAVRQVMRVASGLDSMVLGEPQILGQLKTAYHQAQAANTLGPALSRLFRQSFEVAKRVRTDTTIGENPISVAFAAVSLAKHIFSELRSCRALLVGAGETIELVARHLMEQGISHVVVANRTRERAQELAKQLPIIPIALSELPDYLHAADIVITSTASQLPLLGKGAVERALKQRKYQPMFMVDLAVPRDIEPEVGELRDVYLYTVDDLQEVIAENMKSRLGAAEEAELIIDQAVKQFFDKLRELESVDVLKNYRQFFEKVRDEEVQKARQALQKGEPSEQVLAEMARALTNKFMHVPTLKIKEASSQGHKEILLWVKDFFEIHSQD